MNDSDVPEPQFETLDDGGLSNLAIAFFTTVFGLFLLLMTAVLFAWVMI